MTLTREQTERLARMIAFKFCDDETCEITIPHGVTKHGLLDAFDPIHNADQFDVILRSHYIRASKANLDNLRDVMMCGHRNITDWRAAVLVKIAEVG